jgi:hypothetical protein
VDQVLAHSGIIPRNLLKSGTEVVRFEIGLRANYLVAAITPRHISSDDLLPTKT